MKILIDLDVTPEDFKRIQVFNIKMMNNKITHKVYEAVQKGIVLPKGHEDKALKERLKDTLITEIIEELESRKDYGAEYAQAMEDVIVILKAKFGIGGRG